MTKEQYERMITRARKLADKIEGMSAEEFDKFIKPIIARIGRIEKKMIKSKNKIEHIENLPTRRNLTAPKEILIHLASVVGTIGFENLFISTIYTVAFSAPMDNEMLQYLLLCDLIALWPGYLGGKANSLAYEEKTLTKYLERFRITNLQKKLTKLDDERLVWMYIHKHLQNAHEEDMLYPSTKEETSNISNS